MKVIVQRLLTQQTAGPTYVTFWFFYYNRALLSQGRALIRYFFNLASWPVFFKAEFRRFVKKLGRKQLGFV